MRNFVNKALPCLALLAAGTGAFAVDPVVIPTAVDTGAYISAGITLMGTVAAVAVGGYFSFLVLRKGLKWAGRAMG